MKVTIEEKSGYCPIQIFGDIDGKPFYHRMRSGVDFCLVNNPDLEPTDVYYSDADGFSASSQFHPELDTADDGCGYPGYAKDDEALRSLMWAVYLYRQHLGLFGMENVSFENVDLFFGADRD